jgi:hypothetical protein
MVAYPGQAIYPAQEMVRRNRTEPQVEGAQRAVGHLADALESAGWRLVRPKAAGSDLQVSRGEQRFAIELKYAREPRRPILRALLADAILSGRARAGEREVVAVVGAPAISSAMAASLEAYASEVAPGQPFGYVDERGLVRLHGPGLEDVRREPAPAGPATRPQAQPRDLFSDMNQWMLKVLVARPLAEKMISIPRQPVGSAARLARVAGASVPAAWRLLTALNEAGHLDERGHLVRIGELFARWRAAALRPQRELGAIWILPGRSPLERLRRELANMAKGSAPSAGLGLFAACDALGVGHVRGAPVHLYVRRADPEMLEKLGLIVAEDGRAADLVLRVARWPESIFRAAARIDGVPVSDVIQCWLDVSSHPARGGEQAAFIWKRVLGPALASGEQQP